MTTDEALLLSRDRESRPELTGSDKARWKMYAVSVASDGMDGFIIHLKAVNRRRQASRSGRRRRPRGVINRRQQTATAKTHPATSLDTFQWLEMACVTLGRALKPLIEEMKAQQECAATGVHKALDSPP